jgi:UDP-N-acetylglucosamine--N-acetylmuramyl-(pentapeptide) pyrophosphoryl-undecaprenol N-acetylglucosamine transferase
MKTVVKRKDASARATHDPPTILLAGGGSGGHIYPNLAVIEVLKDRGVAVRPHLLISQRPLDQQIAGDAGLAFTALPARPWSMRPRTWPGWWRAWRASVRAAATLIARYRPAAVMATGGFVSAPVLAAARHARVPAALISLDAVPGRANAFMRRKVEKVFTAYPVADWTGAQTIGYPLRPSAIGPKDRAAARRQLGIEPSRPMLVICGGSQGADTINRMIEPLLAHSPVVAALHGWLVLHITGRDSNVDVARAYRSAGVRAHVIDFLPRMDLAWAGAELAISRAGAGSVAEAWANATPTIFLPYPFHRDEHQRLNAQPLVELDAAVVYRDLADPAGNAEQLAGPLTALLTNDTWRATMRGAMRAHPLPDAASIIAQWLADKATPTGGSEGGRGAATHGGQSTYAAPL